MSDIMVAIKGFLSMAWNFLMHTYIPGTDIAFGVMFVGIAMIGIGFRFLSLAIGVNVGEPLGHWESIGPSHYVSYKPRITDGRKNDTR